MAQTTETATILTPLLNDVNHTRTQSSWSFLSNDISPTTTASLNFRGVCCIIIGIIAIGCEAGIMSKVGNSTSFTIDNRFEIFGGYLLALGIFVMLVCHHKVYALTIVFILSFYELITLVRTVVSFSVMIVNWDKSYGNIMSTDSDLSTVKALTIVCLVCACLGLLLTHSFMSSISQECQFQSHYIPPQQQQMTFVAYANPVATIPIY